MKIAIPIERNEGLDSKVFGHFGSAPFFAVYDQTTQELFVINNQDIEHVHGQCIPAKGLKERGVDIAVCNGLGLRAIQNLNGAGIKVYFAENAIVVKDILNKFSRNELKEFDASAACAGHDCH